MTQPITALDLTDDLAIGAGRLLVGMGADVIRIEVGEDGLTNAAALHWHSGKRIIKVHTPAEIDDVLAQLVPGADVVIESGPTSRLRSLTHRQQHPHSWGHIAHVVVTPFGLTGPRADWVGDDAVLGSAGGMTWLIGPSDGPPQPAPRQQATQLASTHAVIAALLALYARRKSGSGQLARLSVQEIVAASIETGAIGWIYGNTIPTRSSGVYSHVAHRLFETADGHVAGGYSGPNRMWDDLVSWMAETGEADDLTEDRWADQAYRWKNRPHVDRIVAEFCRRRSSSELAAQGRARALPWAAVEAPQRLIENPQLNHRQFFLRVNAGPEPVVDVGFPYQSPAQPRPVTLEPPEPIATTSGWRVQQSAPRIPPAPVPIERPLDGVRVLDLTWVLAGPYVTRTLGDFGAEIIKVESKYRQDPTRFAPSMWLHSDGSPEKSGYFINFNRNKRSIALNLKIEQAQATLRSLASQVDVVVENFSPGTLAKWGMSWEELSQTNPNLIVASMSGTGATGPWKRAVTFADTLAAMSGHTYETRTANSQPHGITFGLGDIIAANATTVAILEYLYRGHGGHIDLSQLEAMASQIGPAVLETTPDVSGIEPSSPLIFAVQGINRWLCVSTSSPTMLSKALMTIFGSDDMSHVRAQARHLPGDELAEVFQHNGVGAYMVNDGRDLVEHDPQLRARSFFATQDHPILGKVAGDGVVIELEATPGAVTLPAPLLGEHTAAILTEILDLTPTQIQELHDAGALQ